MSPRERQRIGIIEDDPTAGGTLVHRLELDGYAHYGGARAKRRSKGCARRGRISSSAISVFPI